VNWLETRLKKVTLGAAVLPLVVLFLIYFFDEFDTAAFTVLAPKIRHAFHLTIQGFGGLVAVNLVIVLAAAVPLGYYGDRLPRRAFVVGGAIVAGVFSFFTGLVNVLWLLYIVRIGNGFGLLVNDPVHRSLLADYYEPNARPTVFATHANAVRWGSIIGPLLAGGVAVTLGWRWAFLILIVPIVIMAIVAMRLPDVIRGVTDNAAAAAAAAEEPPVPFDRSVRMLWNVPTLRRQYYAWIFIGAGLLPLAFYFPNFLDLHWNLNSAQIGVVIAIGSALALVGVQVSGNLTRRWLARDFGVPLVAAGVSLLLVGPGLLLAAYAPNLGISLVGIWWAYFIGGVFTPPYYTTLSFAAPARVRTLAFSFGSLFLAGGFIVFLVFFGGIANGSSRAGIASLVPCWIIGGLVLASARTTVENDTKRALDVLTTTAELRAARLQAGERSLLLVRAVDVAYDQTQVLFGVDFDVKEGEIIAILGTNGAGKSTLLKAIAGSIEVSGGAIFYDGSDITGLGAPRAAADGIALVPGGKGVFPGLTVGENMNLASWLLYRDAEHVQKAATEALTYFPILRERWEQKAGNLSGGEQQMLTIAMALLAKPRLLMIDELSLGLAPVVVEQLLDVVRDINASGVTVVLVEQSVNVALTLAQRAVFMEKGEVRFDGPTAELLDRPDVLRSVFLEGAAAAVGARESGLVGGDVASERLTRVKFKAPVDRKGRPRPPSLIVRELSVSFGGIRAVDSVDLDVFRGQIVGIIGPNGAGKTTVFDLISGFLPPDQGRITLGGVDITRSTPDARSRLGLGRSFQDARLFPSMTVRQTIAVALERHVRSRDPLAAALASPATKAAEREVTENVDRLVELMRLGAFADKFIHELSTGSRRIVDLACVLAHEPTVLLLDEPSSGIAQRETEALGPLLVDIRDETDAGLVVIEHDMPLITSIADHIVALELGSVIVEGEPDDVINDPRVVASYLGTSEEVIQRSGSLGPRRRRSAARPAVAKKAAAKKTARKATAKKASANRTAKKAAAVKKTVRQRGTGRR
jgi:branched-chain amino acid transport system ATP-binding protein